MIRLFLASNRLKHIAGLGLAIVVCVGQKAHSESSCAPADVRTHFDSESDKFFDVARIKWETVTRSRPAEGAGSCPLVSVPGYEGFPTRRCSYSDVDAGAKRFQPLAAQVILLDPSARELARWSVHACRVNGAGDDTMADCLSRVQSYVQSNNSGQFPVSGSIVESICNSNGEGCDGLAANAAGRAPRNTLFRDGVNIFIETITKWTTTPIATETYEALFDVASADKQITSWRSNSRIAGATRDDWKAWRDHLKKPYEPGGQKINGFDLEDAGWGLVSREVHKNACRGDDNELLDAVVFNKKI